MRVRQTIRRVTKAVSTNVGTSVARAMLKGIPEGDVLHIANTHATQTIYVKWVNIGDQEPTITSTDFYEKIPAGESRQFQMENPSVNPDQGLEFFLLGSGATTTYCAVCMR